MSIFKNLLCVSVKCSLSISSIYICLIYMLDIATYHYLIYAVVSCRFSQIYRCVFTYKVISCFRHIYCVWAVVFREAISAKIATNFYYILRKFVNRKSVGGIQTSRLQPIRLQNPSGLFEDCSRLISRIDGRSSNAYSSSYIIDISFNSLWSPEKIVSVLLTLVHGHHSKN